MYKENQKYTSPHIEFGFDNLKRRLRLEYEMYHEDIEAIVNTLICLENFENDNMNPCPDYPSPVTILTPNSKSLTACTKTVITKAYEKPRYGREFNFYQAYGALCRYYENCRNKTALGIFLTLVWRPSELRYVEQFFSYAKRFGTRTLILLQYKQEIYPLRFYK